MNLLGQTLRVNLADVDPESHSSRCAVDPAPRRSSSTDDGEGSASASSVHILGEVDRALHNLRNNARPRRIPSTDPAYIDENVYDWHLTSQHTQTGLQYSQTAVTMHDKGTNARSNVQWTTTHDNGNDPMWYLKLWKTTHGEKLHTCWSCKMGGKRSDLTRLQEVPYQSELRRTMPICKMPECIASGTFGM